MARHGENIYKRKDGRWEGRFIRCYDSAGKAKYTSLYAWSYRDVKEKLLRAQTDLFAQRAAPPLAGRSCGEWVADWLKHKRIHVKESTFARYESLTRRHIVPQLGRYPIGRISTELLETYTAGLMRELSPKTVADVLVVLKAVFRYAERYGVAAACTFQRLSAGASTHEMRILSPQEEQKLTEALLLDSDRTKDGVLLALYTGIRLGELCALTWQDISLDGKVIHIRRTVQRLPAPAGSESRTHLMITPPKSQRSNRVIPLPDFLVDIIAPMAAPPETYFLSGTAECVEPRTMQNRFKAYLRAAGVAEVNFHALRHTFATRCVEAGFDVKSLSEILGHSSVKITLDRYVHSTMEQKRANMNRLSLPR